MKAVYHTMQALRAALLEGAPLPSTSDAAVEYARFCEQARQRLESVTVLLQQGNEYQALQIAEEDPPLLDLLSTLRSGEEQGWPAFCRAHDLRGAPQINTAQVRGLEALYAKGASASHPLYKDFRAAVLARDDVKSLKMVRTILRLNPADDNARQELERLENKQMQEQLEELKEALKTDDEERIATLTEAIMALAPAGKRERLEVFEQGDTVRRALRGRQLRARLPELLADLVELRKAGRWQALGSRLETLRATAKDLGVDLSTDKAGATLNELQQACADEKAAEARRKEFEKTLKSFETFVDEVEARLLGSAGMSLEETISKDDAFVRRWKEVEAFQLPVASDRIMRLTAAGQGLRARVQQLQRGRRLRKVALVAVITLAVLSLAGIGAHRWKAHTLADELAVYQAADTVVPAEELVRRIQRNEALLLHWPRLEAKTAEAVAWTSQARVAETQARVAVQALEAIFARKDKGTLPPVTHVLRQMVDASALVKQVARDLAPELQNRLAALQTQQDAWLAGSRKKIQDSAALSLTEIEPLLGIKLSYDKPVQETTRNLEGLNLYIAPLEVMLKPEADALQLPADLASRIKAMRERLNVFQGALDNFAEARALIRKATSLEEYRRGLQKWQTLPFAEAAPALPLLNALPTEKAFHAALLTGGNEEMLQAVLDDEGGRNMAPNTSIEADRKVLLSLMSSPELNDVREHTLITYGDHGGSHTVWSRGPLRHAVIGTTVVRSGLFFDPAVSQSSVSFIQKEYARAGEVDYYQGQTVTDSHLSGTSTFMNTLQVGRMTDENGEHIHRSLMDVFEKLVEDKDGSPLAKAYVLLRLESMAAHRPYAWGLHFCPTLQADLRGLHQVLDQAVLQADDWLLPAMRERWNGPLAAFFATCTQRSYLKEATVRRDFLRAAATAGLKFGGYLETDLSLALNPGGRAAPELWLMSRDGGRPLLIPNATTAANVSGALPLSPVFFIPVNRRQLVQRYTDDAVSAGATMKPLRGDALLLTAPPL